MKLNSTTVKWFESEQQKHGTKTALYNFIWTIGADIFKMAGIRHIKAK